ncbi:MAG: hypothetical protein ABI882_06200 [Acidobacteriota bacterium]
MRERTRGSQAKCARMVRAISALGLWFLQMPGTGLAQCAMCRASLANSEDPGRVSADVNAGILILLLPTLLLIGAIAGLVMRYYRADLRNQKLISGE